MSPQASGLPAGATSVKRPKVMQRGRPCGDDPDGECSKVMGMGSVWARAPEFSPSQGRIGQRSARKASSRMLGNWPVAVSHGRC